MIKAPGRIARFVFNAIRGKNPVGVVIAWASDYIPILRPIDAFRAAAKKQEAKGLPISIPGILKEGWAKLDKGRLALNFGLHIGAALVGLAVAKGWITAEQVRIAIEIYKQINPMIPDVPVP